MSFSILPLLLHTKFAFWFLPFSTRICGKFMSARAEDLRPPCGRSASFRTNQPQNSSEKVKFSVSCTVPLLERYLMPSSGMVLWFSGPSSSFPFCTSATLHLHMCYSTLFSDLNLCQLTCDHVRNRQGSS